MNFINLDHVSKVIEDYDLLTIIDRSDHSTVFKALDKHNGLIVAIKAINLINQQEVLQAVNFFRSKHFQHIQQVETCFGQEGKLYIVMEYFSGGSLKQLQPLQSQYVQIIMRETLLGLQEIHAEGCFSLLLAANIFLSPQAKIKLSYFSIDQHFADTINKSQSHILSQPYWMAPETIQTSISDQKSDIWALGITAYELITNHIPYEEIPPQKVIFKIVQQPPKLVGNYPPDLIDFVNCCLQKDPLQRPTASQLLQHPFITKSKKTQLLFELLERTTPIQEYQNEILNYTHSKVVTLKLDENYTPEDDDIKEETLKIKRTFRKIEKYKPGLGKIIYHEIMQLLKTRVDSLA